MSIFLISILAGINIIAFIGIALDKTGGTLSIASYVVFDCIWVTSLFIL